MSLQTWARGKGGGYGSERAENLCVAHSYPRLTLDFHTNKRIIDEVVSIYYLLEEVLITNLFSVICYN